MRLGKEFDEMMVLFLLQAVAEYDELDRDFFVPIFDV